MDKGEVLAELATRLDPIARYDEKVNATLTRALGAADAYLNHVPPIECADGFHMSVQASTFHYCEPRTSTGPWATVEVGFPSERVEAFMPYIDGADSAPTDTVYGYVPLDLVADAIVAHGGFADKDAALVAASA